MSVTSFVSIVSKYLRSFLFASILCLVSCKGLEYKGDIAFISSGYANSPEYPIFINDKICSDLSNEVGLCALRMKRSSPIKVKIKKQIYSYRINVICSDPMEKLSFDVPTNTEMTFNISDYKQKNSFTCTLQIFPHGRTPDTFAFAHLRVLVVDDKYQSREKITRLKVDGEDVVIVGQHAKYVRAGEKTFFETTTIEKPKRGELIYSESEKMRFNFTVSE